MEAALLDATRALVELLVRFTFFARGLDCAGARCNPFNGASWQSLQAETKETTSQRRGSPRSTSSSVGRAREIVTGRQLLEGKIWLQVTTKL